MIELWHIHRVPDAFVSSFPTDPRTQSDGEEARIACYLCTLHTGPPHHPTSHHRQVSSKIYEKAVSEPHNAAMYAAQARWGRGPWLFGKRNV